MVRHFLSQNDLTPDEVRDLFARAAAIKRSPFGDQLRGKSLVMFFEKTSTRTRLSFEIGMTQLGGHAVYLDRESSQLSRGESIRDTAEVVSRYADLMMARVYAHATVADLAHHATIPVINGLSDEEHPCQSLADLFTMLECKGRIEGLRIAYMGDGNNNVTHSLMLGATQLGADVVVASPAELQPSPSFVQTARHNADQFGGSVTITTDPFKAVEGADVVYTDVWISMGREDEEARRMKLLAPYQVNEGLLATASSDCIFMHCLPAHVGDEVTEEVAYSAQSVIFDQAENRLHVQKALMLYLLELSSGG